VGPGPCPSGPKGVAGPPGPDFDTIAYKIMHDPDFDPLFLIQKLLADYIANYSGTPENELDELIEKYFR
jgi:hypothetical protein